MRELLRLSFNKRFRQVFSLFLTFVFQFWWLGRQKKSLSSEEAEKKYRQLYRKQARAFTETAIDLGGLLIKLGQFFSSRVDILPKEYTDELAKLQDAVEPVATEVIKKRLAEEFAAPLDSIFAEFSEEPVAAASLGQVYEARLYSGEKVAVKVLRPGIEKVVAVDLETLKVIIAFSKRYRRLADTMDLDQVYMEFRETVSNELDYEKEADNAERFREMFQDNYGIYIPRMFKMYSTARVLTMEFVEGLKINEFRALEGAGLNRKEIADNLLACYLKQVLVEGFFHADPHPGNLLVKEDGAVILLDFGMVGQVNHAMKQSMVNLAVALFKKDPGAVVGAFDELGFLRPHADRSTILKSVRLMMANIFGNTLDFDRIDFTELSLELRELVYSQPFQMPAQTTFLGKALITVFGICNGLDEEFDLMAAVSPYIEEMFLPEAEAPGENFITAQLKKTLSEVIAIPDKVNRFIDGLESGDIRLHPSRSFEQRLVENQSYLTNRIVYAVLASGFAISGAQLLENYFVLGVILISIGGLMALMSLRRVKGSSASARMGKMGSGFRKPRLHP